MNHNPKDKDDIEIIKGEFVTDGKTFAFRLTGTPISGIGATPDLAFQALLSAEKSSGELSERLKELARDQQGEKVRSTIIRMTMSGLIAFGVVAGALVGAAAMLPHVAADFSEVVGSKIVDWVEKMPPETEARLSRVYQRACGSGAQPSEELGAPPTTPAPGQSQ